MDGLNSYVGAIKRAFSDRVRTGKPGRPPRVCPPGLLLAQVVKTSLKRRVVAVSRRIVLGHPDAVAVSAHKRRDTLGGVLHSVWLGCCPW